MKNSSPTSQKRTTPKVSVVVPCFNSQAYLRETLLSIIEQTLTNVEIVLVDDGSSDDTQAIIQQFIAQHPQRLFQMISQENLGVAAARNAGIAASNGTYILPLDADDLIEPSMLSACAERLDKDPRLSVIYTDRKDFGDIDQTLTAGEYKLERLKYFNQLSYCCMYRKSAWESVGGYRSNVSGFDDWDLWIAMALKGHLGAHIDKPLLLHRRHRRSQLWDIIDRYERLFSQIIVNNSAAYNSDEVKMASKFIKDGTPSRIVSLSKLIFMGRYYEDYPEQGETGTN